MAIEAGRGLVRSDYVRTIPERREVVRVALVTLVASPSKTALVFVERTPAPLQDPDIFAPRRNGYA